MYRGNIEIRKNQYEHKNVVNV